MKNRLKEKDWHSNHLKWWRIERDSWNRKFWFHCHKFSSLINLVIIKLVKQLDINWRINRPCWLQWWNWKIEAFPLDLAACPCSIAISFQHFCFRTKASWRVGSWLSTWIILVWCGEGVNRVLSLKIGYKRPWFQVIWTSILGVEFWEKKLENC